MRKQSDRTADERNAAALRRLALVGEDLSGDGRVGLSEDDSEVEDVGEIPGSSSEAGRHAAPSTPSRRPLLSGLHDRLPPFLHARLGGAGLTAQHVVVVVAVVVGFLALAVWWIVSSRPSEVTPMTTVTTQQPADQAESTDTAAPAPTASDGATGETGNTGDPAATGKVIVDVTGKVGDPGIVSLPQGSRVADAIEAAGGPAHRKVDMRAINLARVLVDGEQIVVGMPRLATPAPGTETPGGTGEPGAPTTVVNLNTATLEQLDTLPGVGPVTGQAILDWRDEHGQFSSVDELLEVDGIGDVTLEELRDLVTV